MRAILTNGGKAVAIQGDVSKAADVRRLFDEAERAFGTLDIVVANAAVTETDMMLSEMRAYGTTLSPFGRTGSADEVAAVVAFLASPDGHWVTAQNVQAGGGVAF